MWLRLLIPFTLLWPVLALAVEASPLRRYRGTPRRELLAMAFCCIAYLLVWLGLYRLGVAVSGSEAAGIVAATVLSLLAVIPLLGIGYKLFGVRREEARGSH